MGRLCAYDEIPEQGSAYGIIPEEHGLDSPRTSVCPVLVDVYRSETPLTNSRYSAPHLEQRCREKFAAF